METAKEIFYRYFDKEVIINSQEDFERLVILPAMEAFARQTFDAARQTSPATDNYTFSAFEDYQPALLVPDKIKEKDSKAAQLQNIADSILPQYIPLDPAEKNLSFSFTTEGSRYTVSYARGEDGYWQFDGYKLQQ